MFHFMSFTAGLQVCWHHFLVTHIPCYLASHLCCYYSTLWQYYNLCLLWKMTPFTPLTSPSHFAFALGFLTDRAFLFTVCCVDLLRRWNKKKSPLLSVPYWSCGGWPCPWPWPMSKRPKGLFMVLRSCNARTTQTRQRSRERLWFCVGF